MFQLIQKKRTTVLIVDDDQLESSSKHEVMMAWLHAIRHNISLLREGQPAFNSESSTLQQLSDQLRQLNIKIHYLPEQQDVDVIEDLFRLQVTLAAEEILLSAQKQLLDWLSRTSSAT